MQLTRRGILIGALTGGGLIAGYLLRPRSYPLPLEPGQDEVAFDAWIKVARDGVITIAVPDIEMGQGVSTVLPQVAAAELGADWRQIAVEPAPVSAHYANFPLAARWSELWMPALPSLASEADDTITQRWARSNQFMATADGMSLAAYEQPIREAAAVVRSLLTQAAADRWDVPWEECTVANGFVLHGDNREPFASLVNEAAAYDPPSTPPLLADPASEEPGNVLAGTILKYPRLDLPSKVDGQYLFAGDVRLPGMVHAAIRHGPIGLTELDRFDEDAAKGTQGLISIVKGKRWLAAVASNWWAAEKALERMRPSFRTGGKPDSDEIEKQLDKAMLYGEAERIFESGSPDGMLDRDLDLARRYEIAPALHGTIETASATARLSGGKLELWVAAQAPQAVRQAAAKAIGIDVRDVVLYSMPAGGSFDRRLEHDHAVEAAVIARETGKPVQLTWSRWQEHLAGWPRTPVVASMGARTDEENQLVGWRARLALPASGREFGRRMFDGQAPWKAIEAGGSGADALAMEGAIPFYGIENVAIEHVPVEIALPTGRMRGNAHGYTAFFNECFIDELARHLQREPLSFRIGMLDDDVRMAECLQRAATMAKWDGGIESGKGLACHKIGEGRIAVVATARREENGVRVTKISAVADIGRIVNVDIARQQIEGGLIFGLGLAIGSSSTYERGQPASRSLSDLALPSLAECPEIEVDFISSDETPADPGELGVAAVAPAIANALFAATGLRFRRLPLFSEGL